MAEKMRYNKIIDLLEHGKPVFSTSTVPNGSLDDLTYIADADYDAVIIEMEHEGFSFTVGVDGPTASGAKVRSSKTRTGDRP